MVPIPKRNVSITVRYVGTDHLYYKVFSEQKMWDPLMLSLKTMFSEGSERSSPHHTVQMKCASPARTGLPELSYSKCRASQRVWNENWASPYLKTKTNYSFNLHYLFHFRASLNCSGWAKLRCSSVKLSKKGNFKRFPTYFSSKWSSAVLFSLFSKK